MPFSSLVTESMLQCGPNRTELRSMDSFIQILCRFQKSNQKVPPLSLPCTKNHPLLRNMQEKYIFSPQSLLLCGATQKCRPRGTPYLHVLCRVDLIPLHSALRALLALQWCVILPKNLSLWVVMQIHARVCNIRFILSIRSFIFLLIFKQRVKSFVFKRWL